MRFGLLLAASLSLIVVTFDALAEDAGHSPQLTGAAAFGGWKDDAPGQRRLIRPDDLPPPFATPRATNGPEVVALPADAALQVPKGFHATLVAKGYQQPRVIRAAPNGDLFLADSGAGTVHVLKFAGDALVSDTVFASGLNQPYGIAFYPPGPNSAWVYVASTNSVVRFPYRPGDSTARGPSETVIPDLPESYHWTRDIAFIDGGRRLLVAVGSNSNAAEDVKGLPDGGIAAWAAAHPKGAMWDREYERADVLSFTPEGKERSIFATGIRNCAGMAVEPVSGQPWCVTNERDQLGDNLPPDYATHLEAGAFYGWPWYYTGGREDPRPPLKGQRPDLAASVTEPDVLIQAHSAPLGIAFYDARMFPPDYAGSAFVTLHGSWNRGARTGYKVVRLILKDGRPTGAYEDFATGFVTSAEAVWGRPVGVAVGHDGSLFITEDGNGTLWRISYGLAHG